MKKNNFKKILRPIATVLASISAVLIPTLVLAAGDALTPNSGTLQNPLSSKFNTVAGLTTGFVDILSYIGVIVAVLALIYVGFEFVISGSKPERMKELKSWLLWIVIGVAVIIGAKVIITVLLNTLKATNTIEPSIINSGLDAVQGK